MSELSECVGRPVYSHRRSLVDLLNILDCLSNRRTHRHTDRRHIHSETLKRYLDQLSLRTSLRHIHSETHKRFTVANAHAALAEDFDIIQAHGDHLFTVTAEMQSEIVWLLLNYGFSSSLKKFWSSATSVKCPYI